MPLAPVVVAILARRLVVVHVVAHSLAVEIAPEVPLTTRPLI